MAILVLLHEGLTIKKFPLEKPEISIGRKADCDIFLDDNLVSQRHARIKRRARREPAAGAGFLIEDLQSTNHTFVNGEAVETKELIHNDMIRIGKHVFKFIDEEQADADKTTKLHKSWIPGVYYTKE